jgi:hypothetical protein
MRTLRKIVDSGPEDEILVPDFLANVAGMAVIVQAILERTAVVYPPGRVEDKHVIKLDFVQVAEKELRWVSRTANDLRERKSRKIGYVRGFKSHLPAKKFGEGYPLEAISSAPYRRDAGDRLAGHEHRR